jgi:single-strand DNA-binding protein
MASYNRVIMMGNLTRDPEYKQLSSGQAVCRLGLASNRQFKSKQTGMLVQEVCFVDIDVWGPQGESCSQYLKKGSGVLVEGRLKLDTWQDTDGSNRSKHFIVADRVTFLPASSSVQDESLSQSSTSEKPASVEPVEQSVAPAKMSDNSTGEVAFKDKPPFEDDLPF